LARLLSVPLTVWLLLVDQVVAAFWLFVAAGLSDAVDGALAKRLNASTELGRYLDPLADKALLVGVYVTLGIREHLPVWLVILVVFRDLLIVGGAVLQLLMGRATRIMPLMISKANTAAQIVLAALVLGRLALGFPPQIVIAVLIVIVAATTVLSGGTYLVEWARASPNGKGTT
jgi:cardiolipin synthase